ncbi:phospholipase D-like domain-containing protein [Xanthobacter autotrophicus]|uniref:hypothetical protein n=1 Tax=Xanthobacter autotrophicus TaxID=280 RepID=UPI003728A32C
MNRSLLTLFAPPEEYMGDFGMLCGFTASRDVLDRIARIFSGDGSRPRLAAFIHPTAAAVTDVPGVAWMHFRSRPPFRLLHAKVALLGFRAAKGYCLRLAVSTGNWTAEPLTTSIDMFWCDEIVTGAGDPQLVSDIQAAGDLFRWLRTHCDDGLLRQTFDGTHPDESFREAIAALPASPRPPRFMDTRTGTMQSQVIERLTGRGKKRFVIGSGFYEGDDNEKGDGLIERLRAELVRNGRLAGDAALDLVLNPESCQGLHKQAARLVEKGWALRKPGSCHAEHSKAKLHAKYLFLAKHSGTAEIGPAQIYIGSANFSRMGFESVAPDGNLEAGIVIAPDPKLSWRRNAKDGIRDFLPGDFDTKVDVANLLVGPLFEPPSDPPPPPPVTFVEWAGDRLSAPGDCEEALEILSFDGAPAALPCDWPAPPPTFITLYPSGWKVPVRTDGALVVPKRGRPSLEDILAGVGRFPAFAIGADEDGDDGEGRDQEIFGEPGGSVENASIAYPIRQMMRLITRLAEAQKALDPRDWQRWCRELQQDLPALAETEAAMIAPFKAARANPLCALANAEFLPSGVDKSRIEAALSRIEETWGLSGARDLWERMP